MNFIKTFEKRNLSLSVAESATGGSFSSKLTSIPGSSKWFKGSVVVYTNEAKQELLNIIVNEDAVSERVASEMAENISSKLSTDVSISFTGNAGPNPMEGKEVGEVFISIFYEGKTETIKYISDKKERNEIINDFVEQGINLLNKKFNN